MPRSPSPPKLAATFGTRVRERRERQGLSQMALAESAGMHFTYLGRIERGEQNVTILTLCRLAEALGVDPSTLVKGLKTDRRR